MQMICMQPFYDANADQYLQKLESGNREYLGHLKNCPGGPSEQLHLVSSAVPCAFSLSQSKLHHIAMTSISLGSRNQAVPCPRESSYVMQTYVLPKITGIYLYTEILVFPTPSLLDCCHLKLLFQHLKLQPFVCIHPATQICYLSDLHNSSTSS